MTPQNKPKEPEKETTRHCSRVDMIAAELCGELDDGTDLDRSADAWIF